ncbi:uncharacterized protein LAJ45_08434 [Morchella importuna]|uniref:uncharacterized protein n=1 Tax=Morchella importuna TaxID=1174673 RepID=UPI001E8E6834|nr:uncharacterized protein LAJ45_08434 [Morchella importuna]KAH8147606.1 hypothetical protein LAJ45_08434 [Morchella importuna]
MHTFRVSNYHHTAAIYNTCTRGCYDRLWDIDGEHQKIEGWPFVSTGEIRRYYANRDAASLNLDKANSMEETPILMTDSALDIYGDRYTWRYPPIKRNPLCTKGAKIRFPDPGYGGVGKCTLGSSSKNMPHCCDETGKVTCKKHLACNFTCSTREELEDHFKTYRYCCPVLGCKRFGEEKGFPRKDNLTQHIRKVHKRFIPRVATRFAKGGGVSRTVIDKLPQDPRLGTFELAEAPSEAVGSDVTSAEEGEHMYSGGESSFMFKKVQEGSRRL